MSVSVTDVWLVFILVVLLLCFLLFAVYMSGIVGSALRDVNRRRAHAADRTSDPVDREFEEARQAMRDAADGYRRRAGS